MTILNLNIEYNFHDAALISSHFEENKLILEVQLYEIYYANKDRIKITFSDIYNLKKVSKLNSQLNSDKLEPAWIGNRIEALHLDQKKISKEGDVYIFVRIDQAPSITIHCKDLNIEQVK